MVGEQITDRLNQSVCSMLGWGSSLNLHLQNILDPKKKSEGPQIAAAAVPFPWRQKKLGRGRFLEH
eukprot:12405492-Karenia_brevis.AAC.1